jgi:DNA-binding beta-propeller fold protein YncE
MRTNEHYPNLRRGRCSRQDPSLFWRGLLTCLPIATAFAAPPAQAAQFVLVATNDTVVRKYDAVTGAALSVPFFSLPGSGFHPMVVDQSNHLFVAGSAGSGGVVAEFDAVTGATLNAQFIRVSGLNPLAIALDRNNHLFLADYATNTIGEYDATTGATINRNFIQGLSGPGGMAVDSQNHLFVSNGTYGGDTQTIGKYDATTGATINAAFINGLYEPSDLHVDSLGRLLVAHGHTDSSLIGAFDATTGAAISPGLIYVGAGYPEAFTLDGNNHLFEANFYGGVGEFDATTGAPINASLVTGNYYPAYPTGIVSVATAVPEPSSLLLLAAGACGLGIWRRERAAGCVL